MPDKEHKPVQFLLSGDDLRKGATPDMARDKPVGPAPPPPSSKK